jgi:hypothetical protein
MWWKAPYQKLFASRVIPIAVYNNYRLLEIAGEPVHVLVRVRAEYCAKRLVKVVDSRQLERYEDQRVAVWWVWRSGVDYDEEFPDIRDIVVRVDGVEGVNVYAVEFMERMHHFYVRDVRDDLGHRVGIFFRRDILDSEHRIECAYFPIHPDFDIHTGQVYIGESALSKYGWRQLRWRTYYRGRVLHDVIIVAFPDLRRDLVLDRHGWVPESRYDVWTSAPPFAPILYEHDVLVRLNGLRYEIRNMVPNLVEGVLVQQDFEVSEISPSSPVYDIAVDSLKGTLKGFPERKVYSG